ncbi:MAG: HdeD family acid-resistance protein [Faecousia sp.]
MKFIKKNIGSISICLLEILIGVLLLINPVGFAAGIIIAAGVVLTVNGVLFIIRYFRMNPHEAAISQSLIKGLVLLLLGAFCVFRSGWFIVTFPILTILYGVAILVTGLSKIQWTVDMIRLKQKKWGLAAVSAAVSVLCGIVILHNPFTSTAVLWIFAGIYLIVEAVFDFIVLLFDRKANEKNKGGITYE